MRKFKKILLTIGVVVSCTFTSTVSVFANQDNFLVVEKGASTVESFKANWAKVPESVKQAFYNEDWRVDLVGTHLNELAGFPYAIQAATSPDMKIIFIDNRPAVCDSILHELGHYLDVRKNYELSQSAEFKKIWRKEVGAFCKKYPTSHSNTDSAMEYFAESMEQLFLNSIELAKVCPETASYLNACLDNL